MSNTQYAFLDKCRVPARLPLQASIDALGFDLQLHPELDLLNDTGFSPCVFYGMPDVGFELFSEPAADAVGGNEALKEAIGTRDFSLGMAWRGSMKDCAAVMIVSYALAKNFGAVVSYDGEPPAPLEVLLQALPEIIAMAKDER